MAGTSLNRYEKNLNKCIEIPEDATNGEMLRCIFPNIEVTPHPGPLGMENGLDVVVVEEVGPRLKSCFKLWFPHSWWYSKYSG